jgi:3-methyladenine DNA glycosylase AlkD
MARTLLAELEAELRRVADPAKAGPMQAYMKSAMPFLGVQAGPLRRVCRGIFERRSYARAEEWRREVLAVWRGARYREVRYAAVELTGSKKFEAFQTPESLPMYEEMITTGAWWDLVDAIAVHRLGDLLRLYPRPLRKAMRSWSRSGNLWKRRSAILCQIAFKGETDKDLLYALIRPSLASPEFFLRKAIGWALRQYAWTDPREVVRYVRAHEEKLSPLSAREALKNVGRAGRRPPAGGQR